MLFANSSAILTDAFPVDQRGLALGVNMVAAIAGSFIGLVLGGVLGADLVAAGVPGLGAGRPLRDGVGYMKLGTAASASRRKIDWWATSPSRSA